MDANKILSTDLIDLVFEGRNKSYGAYELRTQYNKRLRNSLVITASIALMLLLGSFLSSLTTGNRKGKVEIKEVQLEEIKQDEPNEPPPPPPPKPPEPPKVEMAKFTPPKVVKDEEVKEDEKPPEIEKLEETKIGTVNQEGVKDEGIVAPLWKVQLLKHPRKMMKTKSSKKWKSTLSFLAVLLVGPVMLPAKSKGILTICRTTVVLVLLLSSLLWTKQV